MSVASRIAIGHVLSTLRSSPHLGRRTFIAICGRYARPTAATAICELASVEHTERIEAYHQLAAVGQTSVTSEGLELAEVDATAVTSDQRQLRSAGRTSVP